MSKVADSTWILYPSDLELNIGDTLYVKDVQSRRKRTIFDKQQLSYNQILMDTPAFADISL